MDTSKGENYGIKSVCYLQGLEQVIHSLHIYEIGYSSANVSRGANAYLLRWCLKVLKLL